METKKYKLDETKLTPEQRDKLETYHQTQNQLKTLQDLADMTHEMVNLLSDANKNTDKLEALGALLTDAREQLVSLNKKEAPEAPDYAKPIVAAIYKLETALPKLIKTPEVKVDAPNVQVAAPDLTEFNRLLRTEIPKAFDKAIKSIPKVEVSQPDNGPLLKAWEGISEQLVSIENATRMKPLPGSIKVSNLSEIVSGLTDAELRATPVPVSQDATWNVNSYPVIYDGASPSPVPGDFTNGIDTDVTRLPVDTYSAVAVDANSSGNNTIVAITNTARLYYVSLSANGANSADVTAIVKIGASEKFKVSLKAGSIFARNIGAGRRYLTGSAGDDIIVNLSTAQTVHVSVEYEDI